MNKTLLLFFVLVQSQVLAEVNFDHEVVPLLSKAGCNAAACHGGAAGQAGFRLSLFGGDPAFDHLTIVRELRGRRINLHRPGLSLLLCKPTGELDHGGGEVLDDDAADVIRRWISEGARRVDNLRLTGLSIEPGLEITVDAVPCEIQLRVVAEFGNERRDVTPVAVYESQNEAAIEIDARGKMTVRGRGRQAAIVRFGSQVKAVSVTSPIGQAPVANLPRSNWIDDDVNAMLTQLRLPAADRADDATFLRRVSLDLTGRLPTPQAVVEFLRDESPSKRQDAINRLLDSDSFCGFWTHRLASWLRLKKPAADSAAVEAFYGWLETQLKQDVGWDAIARQLVMAEGDTHLPSAATVHRFFATAREQAEYVSEVLLGTRMRCANCHNHPLDRWTQDDYHGLAAIFAGYQRGSTVRYARQGEVTHPRTGAAAIPRIPGVDFIKQSADSRIDFVDWMLAPENPHFSAAMVGRVWEALMGRGLVSPVDDVRVTNPASNPRLLSSMSDRFAQNEYGLRWLIREICNSEAYGRSSNTTSEYQDDRFHSVALSKSLSPSVFADAISDVTGITIDYTAPAASEMSMRMAMMSVSDDSASDGGSALLRATEIADRTMTFPRLRFLGECLPDAGCNNGDSGSRGIASKLHLLNGELINRRLVDPRGRLAKLWAKETSTADIVREFYLAALTRFPSNKELQFWCEQIDVDASQRRSKTEDFVWALLNCHEFMTNR